MADPKTDEIRQWMQKAHHDLITAAQVLELDPPLTGARLTGKPVQECPLFKVLDDVSFSIGQGDVVGIIGHNRPQCRAQK